MGRRQQLHQLLKTIADNVYFQPPPNVHLEYPCIIYNRDFSDTKFADDRPYSNMTRYMVMVIDPDPDSEIPASVGLIPRCIYTRFFTADNLNHDVFSLYF